MTGFDWKEFVAQEEVVIVTRFSFLGTSGWKSDFSRAAETLFERDRLELRLSLMDSVNLSSLAAQSDRKFHLYILTSADLPRWALKDLRAACQRRLPEGNFTIAARAPGIASVHLRRFLRARSQNGRAFHLILDDDDALATDFLQHLRERMGSLSAPEQPDQMRFVSFSKGYALDLSDFSHGQLRLFRHQYPFINLGLAMVGPADGKNLLAVAHRKFPKKHEHALVRHGDGMFLRCVHNANDSRVRAHTGRWQEVDNWRQSRDITRRFSFMSGM